MLFSCCSMKVFFNVLWLSNACIHLSSLVHSKSCHRFATKLSSEQLVTDCWLDAQENNVFENVICKMWAILFWPRCPVCEVDTKRMVHCCNPCHGTMGLQGICSLSAISGIILCMCPANERWRYTVKPSLIGWAHPQNDPCWWTQHTEV